MVIMAIKNKPVPYADRYRWLESRFCISSGKLDCNIKKMKKPNRNINETIPDAVTVVLKEGRRDSSQSSVSEHAILVIIIVDPMMVPIIARK